MRTSALVRLSSGIAVLALGAALSAPGAQAALPDPAAPVVTTDTVALYPQGMAIIDVLANDTDPNDPDGSSLALCRLPTLDLDDLLGASSLPSVLVTDAGGLFGSSGSMMVLSMRSKLAKPQVVEYYVCNLTHLTPATLTVTMLETKPVTVRKVPSKPGRLKVTNHNDRRIMLEWTGRHHEGGISLGAHKTRIVHVRGTKVRWTAVIGSEFNSGVAGHGVVRNIKVDPDDKGKPTKGDLVEFPEFFKQLLARVR
jgi:hypothetical protein